MGFLSQTNGRLNRAFAVTFALTVVAVTILFLTCVPAYPQGSKGRILGVVTDTTGRIVDSQALAAAGLKIDSNGNVVDKSGNVVDTGSLVVTKDGVMSQAQLDAAGLKVDAKGNVIDNKGRVLSPKEVAAVAATTPIKGKGGRKIGLIVGGSPTNGVTKTTTLKVTE